MKAKVRRCISETKILTNGFTSKFPVYPFGNVTSSSQTSNPSPAAPSYSFPGSSNAASTMMQQDPEFVNDWRRHFAAYYQRRAASNATGSQHAHPETPLQNREPILLFEKQDILHLPAIINKGHVRLGLSILYTTQLHPQICHWLSPTELVRLLFLYTAVFKYPYWTGQSV